MEMAQAVFVRQDVIYPDRVVTAAPRIAGERCGLACGTVAPGTSKPHAVKERHWYRATDVPPLAPTVASPCGVFDCGHR